MSRDERDTPRTGDGRKGSAKVDVRDCVQQSRDGQIQWRETEKNYPHRGGLDGAR